MACRLVENSLLSQHWQFLAWISGRRPLERSPEARQTECHLVRARRRNPPGLLGRSERRCFSPQTLQSSQVPREGPREFPNVLDGPPQ